ncbi:hypothetical protein F511_11969 [Dorcoceras hygrometricum]|uniref:Uncharacterized protein n=1 Tax=Dorcoceras hygrometricum TaxID=472368 RepID=A0A2Z7CJZ5_9LAMI|nr:hypothetical protein F511_11969 [Dorcoceras hygrometricum]
MTGDGIPSSACTRRPDEIGPYRFSSSSWPEQIPATRRDLVMAWTGPMGPGPTDEHSVHPHHRDFIVTPIADQIGPIDSVSKTEYYDLKNHFSEPQCKMTVLPLNSGKSRFDPCPRPETGFLRQPELEGLTRSARTDSPRQVGRNKFRRLEGGDGSGGTRAATAAAYERREGGGAHS